MSTELVQDRGEGSPSGPAGGDPDARPTRTYRAIAFVSRPLVVGLYRMRVSGVELLPPRGGLVVASNHTSNLDAWPIGIALYPRSLHFMVKREAWWPPLSWILAAGGSFPVRRGTADVAAVATAVKLCRAGGVMAMFPEGTRRSKGFRKRLRPRPHSGAAWIALEAGVPLVPAAIRGMDRLTRLGPLRVAFGSPVELDDLAGRDRREAANEATRRVWAEIGRLEAELRDHGGKG